MIEFSAVDASCPRCDSSAVLTDEAPIAGPLKRLLPGAQVFAGLCRCGLPLTLISVDPARLEMALTAGGTSARNTAWPASRS